MDDYGIGISSFLGQIDVTGMEGLVVTCIINVFPLLRGCKFHFLLDAAETAGRLCMDSKSAQQKY